MSENVRLFHYQSKAKHRIYCVCTLYSQKICWSALDWLVNHKPPPPKDLTPDWRKCKLLGSLLGTEEDFIRRKQLTLNAMKKYENIFKSKHIGNKMKIRTFQMYIASVFLYNTEIWSVNKTLNEKIDSFPQKNT